jgi:hypothetical protein
MNQTWPQSSSGCLIVYDVPANHPTWQPLLKVEHRGKINKIEKNPEKLCEGAIAS